MRKPFLWMLLWSVMSANIGALPAQATHALTLFTEPKYGNNFSHFDYVNPDAPKGGTVKLAYPIPFDSLNPFILKGMAAPDITLIYDTLMVRSLDEAQTFYPLVAESVMLSEDRKSIRFVLNPHARFHDGSRIAPEDIVFSMKMLKEEGHPAYRLRYQEVTDIRITGKREVTFDFATDSNRELPFDVAGLPVLSKAFYGSDEREFSKSSLEVPLTSGPYTVRDMQPGRYIVYERVQDYWAKDLPARKGQFNFNEVRYDVYRDETVALEAFKAGEYDYREEYIARNWALGYDFAAMRDGRVVRDETPHKIPRGMQAFIFNLRKDKFKDRRVREAIGLSFDFEWMNRALFYNAYARNDSFFQNTPFAATGMPDQAELALLEPYKATLPPSVFTKPFDIIESDGSGFIRDRLKQADQLLRDAGWIIRDGKRVHEESGQVLTIEFLARQRSLERLVMAMKRNLEILGIEGEYRMVDDSQYQKRWDQFDFDVTTVWWNRGVIYPGVEQKSFWHCSQADIEGGQNMSGYCHPATDMLTERITSASDYASLQSASKALDRILLHEHIVIPHFSISHFRMAYWDKFGLPKERPAYERGFYSWWLK